LRLELELPSGIVIKARMSKEEYNSLGLQDGKEVSFEIKQYRNLTKEGKQMSEEISAV